MVVLLTSHASYTFDSLLYYIVLDDEESAVVTAGAIVTVTVLLTRNSMGSLLKGESSANRVSEQTVAVVEDLDEDKENREDGENSQAQNKKPVWQKKKGGAKKAGGKGKHPQQQKKNAVLSKPTKSNEVVEKSKELKELPDAVDDSDDENLSDGTVSDSESGSENADKV